MSRLDLLQKKIVTQNELGKLIHVWQLLSQKIVFTNGCFDILHAGHIHTLTTAADFGNKLIVGLNTDASVSKLKPNRPIQNQDSRALVLAALNCVVAVILFDEETPLELIKFIQPDVLVKGGDYTIDKIIGSKEVLASGGKVEVVPLLKGFSTTSIAEKIKNSSSTSSE
ncbi:MAG: D-glycero-beta-D-manno-heptose 1-phosphate adenylyltransferase [Bacteroidota bacterium]